MPLPRGVNQKSNPNFPSFLHVWRQGRETEWLFASREGQDVLVGQAGAARLLFVSCARDGGEYLSMDAVQKELSPFMDAFAPSTPRFR